MQVEWYGQSAFRLEHDGVTVFVDPFDGLEPLVSRGMRWDYPAIAGVEADLLLVTHEHFDHNGVGAIDGDPVVVRALSGRHESPVGDVVGIASEHDDAAGTERGHNVMLVFDLGGMRVAHLGDLGQRALRPEQLEALGEVDLLFVPVGGGPTMDAAQATEVVTQTGAPVVVPMHYRTERIDFLAPVDEFAELAARVERLDSAAFDVGSLPDGDGALVVVPAAP
jgi:L-ascorbate metabolism protein UlaG (beta-lactamase superfamily)